MVARALGSSVTVLFIFDPHFLVPMEFSAVELEIAVELTSLLVCFMMDDDHHLDLDRMSQVESISSAFFAILQACGACDFLLNVKLVWKAAATALATVEAETGMDPAATIPTINHEGPLRPLTVLDHLQYAYVHGLLPEATTGLHDIEAFLTIDHPDLRRRVEDTILILATVSRIMNQDFSPG